jgi:hypothetical protein
MSKLLKLYYIIPYIILVIVSLILRALIPPNVVYGSPHDDLLGVLTAEHILNGDWLGLWNNRSLLKPPGYSYFLVLCHYLNITPHLALHILYIIVSLYFIYILGLMFRKSYSKLLQISLFAFLILNPYLFTQDFSRIYRLSLHTFQVYLFFVIIIHLYIFYLGLDKKLIRFQNSINLDGKQSMLVYKIFALSLGFTYSSLVLSRVEAFWILYPAFFLLLVLIISLIFKKKYYVIRSILSVLFVFIIAWQVPIAAVKQINSVRYQSSAIENYYSGEFARAIRLWTSVVGTETLSVPISKEKREKVYRISNVAFEVSKYLEIPPNTGWKIFNCQQTGECDESGPWFSFMLRDAVVDHFKVTNESDFQEKFKEIADDIENACIQGKLQCENVVALGGSPNILKIPIDLMISNLSKYVMGLINLNSATQVNFAIKYSSIGEASTWKSITGIDTSLTNTSPSNQKLIEDIIEINSNLFRFLYFILSCLLLFSLVQKFKLNLNYLLPKILLLYILICLILFGLGMAVFSATSNNSADNSLYTLPSTPLFQILLILNLVFILDQFEFKRKKVT